MGSSLCTLWYTRITCCALFYKRRSQIFIDRVSFKEGAKRKRGKTEEKRIFGLILCCFDILLYVSFVVVAKC